jgi:hypothetical protein
MKLISFMASGHSSYGAVAGDRIVDLGRGLGDRYPTLRAAIAGGNELLTKARPSQAIPGGAEGGLPELLRSRAS